MKKSYFRYAVVLLLSMLLAPLSLQAQNVTIGPNNGSIITGQAGGNTGDSGIQRGMGSMWRHEQLPLCMTTSDIANLTSAGELADPSCAIDVYNGKLILGAGQTQTFMVVSLPKGYRITRYKLVLQPNITGNITLHPGKNSWAIGTDDHMCFYETPAWSSGSPYGNNTHSTQLTCPDAIATATAADGTTEMQNNNATNQAKEFVIERTSKTDDDMTNQLHFFFARSSNQYAVTINSFEITFTAEGTFDAELAPVSAGEPTSVVSSPFTTSKMDIGAVVYNEELDLYMYDYTKVQDVIAYNWLYQSDAIQGGEPADVAVEKHICPVVVDNKGAYAFGNDTYYVEPPTTIHTPTGWESPIGYRVVGAKFKYDWGTETQGGEVTIQDVCYIRGSYATDNGGSREGGYLNDHLDFTSSTFAWQIDEYGNIYKSYTDPAGNEYRKYLACFGEGDERVLSLSSSPTGQESRFNLHIEAANGNNDRHVYYYSDGLNYYYLNWRIIQEGGDYHSRCYVTKNYNQNLATATTSGSHTYNLPSFHPGAYTLKIYGTAKDDLVETITVNDASETGTYELLGLNNDAVKFEISGLAEGKQALVNVTLMLEALNPYINSMDIVCESEADSQGKKLELVQTFTANDFAVSGGKFIFYIPTDYSGHDLTFTFKDLYSNYGDGSYGGTGNARYSYVTSPYFETVDGVGDNGLYDAGYDPDHESTDKIFTSVAGNVRFKFNNAEDLTGGNSNVSLQEYAFSVSEYLTNYVDPDPDHTKIGAFNLIKMNASKDDQKTGTYYVFTADETRYNIAPSTALEHRSYAFYRMEIELVAKSYIPSFVWTKVYDNTLYVGKDENGNEVPAENDMWGLTLRVKDTDNNDNLIDVPEGTGYLSVKEIVNAFDGVSTQRLDGVTIGGDGAPGTDDQILYIDGSKLQTIVASSGDYSLQSLKDRLATNALIYLPENMTSTADNFAYKTGSNSFLAGKDIVLTDRQPFYAPYDIQVDAANKAIHQRQITNDKNGKVASATVILPFDILVDEDGKHTNANETAPAFSLHQMQETGCLTTAPEGEEAEEYVYFPVLKAAKTTTPNTPYLVKVLNPGDDANVSFVVSQKGALISATTEMADDYTFSGEEASGSAKESNYNFKAYGSYSGKKIAKSETVFYFAKNMFLSTQELTKPYLNVAPFRSYYATTASGGAKLSTLGIIFGEGEGNTDAIRDLRVKEADLAVQAGRGTLTIAAKADNNVRVSGVNGISRYNVNMKAGEVKTINVPAGIYVVNGVKILVK